MSDSAPRKDVEDVLSSIRRLVSSELPRNRRPDLPKGPGALVLTDAQRVETAPAKGAAGKSLEDRIAELEAAVSSRDDDYEPDGSEDQAQHRPDRIVYSRPPSDAEEAEARGQSLRLNRLTLVETEETAAETAEAPEAPDESDAPPLPFRHARRAQPEDKTGDTPPAEEAPMAEDVVETPQAKAEVRPFHNPDDMVGRFEARIEKGDLPSPPGPGHNGFSERLEPYEATRAMPGETGALSAEDAFDEESAEADAGDDDFEAALTEAVSRPAPDARVETEETAAEVAVAPEAPKAAPPAARQVRSEAALDDIDEDLLRPIVAKLIREELQGELGERITRNVRKLVRREILRAINSQELE